MHCQASVTGTLTQLQRGTKVMQWENFKLTHTHTDAFPTNFRKDSTAVRLSPRGTSFDGTDRTQRRWKTGRLAGRTVKR